MMNRMEGHRAGEWYNIYITDSYKDYTLDQLIKHLPIPSKMIRQYVHNHDINLEQQLLRIRLFPPEEPDFLPESMQLDILYEDDFALVVNKPAGLNVHPHAKDQTGTLANAVSAYYRATGQPCRVRHIHRLDRETTGPVLYAKNALAHYVFDEAMREKRIERIYLAIAEGTVANEKGAIRHPIGKDRHHAKRRRVSPTGDPAVTHYEIVSRLKKHMLLKLRLETGRTHQIRVHLSAIGHPIAGDTLYGGSNRLIHRQALHGQSLLWPHPWSGMQQSVQAPEPGDFLRLLNDLRL